MPGDRLDAAVEQLRGLLRSDEEAALELALRLISRERAHRALEPALDVAERLPRAGNRGPLRERFHDLAEHGSRHDQDCSLRVRIVRALRGIGDPRDRDVAEAGLRTVQILPLGGDVAQALRAESLLLLADLDEERADYFAVELLDEPHTSRFSGEPAVTAIRVLARRGHLLPVWAAARRASAPADVVAQAFETLRDVAPKDLQLDTLKGHLERAREQGEEGDATALVAAEAIVLGEHKAGYGLVLELLRETENPSLFRYLVATAARSPDLRAELVQLAKRERDPARLAALREVLPHPS